MSVVPWVRGVTFVTSQEQFAEGGAVLGQHILVTNFDETQLRKNEPNGCYDLRVGPRYQDHRKPDLFYSLEGEFILVAGSAVIIETEEVFHFPQWRFGYVVPKVGMLKRGVSNTMSKVDPGYHGALLVTIFNLGKEDVPIKRRDKICALVVHDVQDGIIPYDRAAKQLSGRNARPKLTLRRLLDKLDARPASTTTVAAVLSVVAAIMTILPRLASVFAQLWHVILRKFHAG
ncbi:MAG TPA: hypothetical protein VEI08_02890 [Candidatus Bathyarchaeia archaeon]|nr:hypothetical protein [Candidatus Bathyarchaeia archaeon]